jgi:predicted Zn-dependent protease with MMP-like domain
VAEFHWPAWDRLVKAADEVVASTRAQLPPEVGPLAAALPVTLLQTPDEEMQADGVAPDLLGLFVGSDRLSDSSSPSPLPAQILLFLDNLWDYADGDWAVFRDEVRTTYLHELGHYLGWGEEEIESRGLG